MVVASRLCSLWVEEEKEIEVVPEKAWIVCVITVAGVLVPGK
jgi:hypothetical protein